MYPFLKKIWQYVTIQKSWRPGLIIKLATKGNTKPCKNWRGITLLSVVGKILCRIIIDRIRSGVDDRLNTTGRIQKRREADRTGIYTAEHH